jgi:hypothetical protein
MKVVTYKVLQSAVWSAAEVRADTTQKKPILGTVDMSVLNL